MKEYGSSCNTEGRFVVYKCEVSHHFQTSVAKLQITHSQFCLPSTLVQ